MSVDTGKRVEVSEVGSEGDDLRVLEGGVLIPKEAFYRVQSMHRHRVHEMIGESSIIKNRSVKNLIEPWWPPTTLCC